MKAEVAARLRLASGLFDTAVITESSSEYDIRNAMSRLYYAFFHVSVALLLSIGLNVESKDHGRVQTAVQRRMGKPLGDSLKKLYRIRKFCDYDAAMFGREYSGDIEKARQENIQTIKRAKTNFHWMYREARKAL